MANFHCSAQVISRKKGRSAVGAGAYRSGEKLTNEYDELEHDYTKKSGIVYSEIMLCQNAPTEYQDREKLWNAVEKSEQSDGRLSREIEVSLPRELSREEQIKLTQDYVRDSFVKNGMCADISIHDKKDGNPHAHIMLTLRPIDEKGKWEQKYIKAYVCKNRQGEEKALTAKQYNAIKSSGEWEKKMPYYKDGNGKSRAVYLTEAEAKTLEKYKNYERVKGKKDPQSEQIENLICKEWNSKEMLENWREEWAKYTNRAYERNGLEERIDHRSLEAQGVTDRLPTIHMGKAYQMEKKGIVTDKGDYNREVRAENMAIKRDIEDMSRQLEDIRRQQENIMQVQKFEAEQKASAEKRKEEERREREQNEAKIKEQATRRDEVLRDREHTEYKLETGHSGTGPATPAAVASPSAGQQTQQDRQKMLEEHGKSLGEIKTEYMKISQQIENAQTVHAELSKNSEIMKDDISQISKHKSIIDGNKEKIERLQEEKSKLGIFKGNKKKTINNQIYSIQKSNEQAIDTLKRNYGITPNQTEQKIQAIKEKEITTENTIKKLPSKEKIEKAKNQLKELEQRYKQLVIMKDMYSEKDIKTIEKSEKEHTKEPTQKGVKSTLKQYETQIKLLKISPQEYKKLKSKLPPNAVEALEKRDKQGGKVMPSYAKNGHGGKIHRSDKV